MLDPDNNTEGGRKPSSGRSSPRNAVVFLGAPQWYVIAVSRFRTAIAGAANLLPVGLAVVRHDSGLWIAQQISRPVSLFSVEACSAGRAKALIGYL